MKNFVSLACILSSVLVCSPGYAMTAPSAVLEPSHAVAGLEQHHRFQQERIAECDQLSGELHWGRTDLRFVDHALLISGVDDVGPYSTSLETGIGKCEIWSADLDGNGSPDLLVLRRSLDSSGEYNNDLSILLFGNNGRPFPWKALGRFQTDDRGIVQLVADASGKSASLIVPQKEGMLHEDANYAWALYRFSPSSVTKTTGQAFGLNWPVFKNPTPMLIGHQKASSLTWDLSGKTEPSRFTGVSSPMGEAEEEIPLENGKTIEPPAVLVEDSPDGRRRITLDRDNMQEELGRLVQRKAGVRTMGTSCEEEECRPFVLLATP